MQNICYIYIFFYIRNCRRCKKRDNEISIPASPIPSKPRLETANGEVLLRSILGREEEKKTFVILLRRRPRVGGGRWEKPSGVSNLIPPSPTLAWRKETAAAQRVFIMSNSRFQPSSPPPSSPKRGVVRRKPKLLLLTLISQKKEAFFSPKKICDYFFLEYIHPIYTLYVHTVESHCARGKSCPGLMVPRHSFLGEYGKLDVEGEGGEIEFLSSERWWRGGELGGISTVSGAGATEGWREKKKTGGEEEGGRERRGGSKNDGGSSDWGVLEGGRKCWENFLLKKREGEGLFFFFFLKKGAPLTSKLQDEKFSFVSSLLEENLRMSISFSPF